MVTLKNCHEFFKSDNFRFIYFNFFFLKTLILIFYDNYKLRCNCHNMIFVVVQLLRLLEEFCKTKPK